MNSIEGHCVRSGQPPLPPLSNRTLHHPSLLPLYMAAGSAHLHADCNNQTVPPIIPAEFFYSDPTMSCGRRIPNIVSEPRVFNCLQLNTPPPVMSACLAPPARPDPFRSGPHPTRDLGRLTLTMNALHPPVQPSRVVLQLTQEEDQAVTNLLKLHHQEPIQRQSDETLPASSVDLNPIPFFHLERMDSTSAEDANKPLRSDAQYLTEGRCWSDTELEAANTLLSRFSLMEKDKIWGQNHNESAATLPDPKLNRRHEDSSTSTETQQGYETFPALKTTGCAQSSCAREYGEPGCVDFGFLVEGRNADDVCESSLSSDSSSRWSVSGDFSEVMELSDSEGDAVLVLLSLGDTGALGIVQ